MTVQRVIILGSNKLEYFVYNESGSKTIICFHGFGQEAQEYKWIADNHIRYRVISINLFYHGNSVLSPKKVLSDVDWKSYFNKVIENEKLNNFSLIGYSMGGRFALTTLKIFPHKVDKIFLVAADGLVASRLFKIATGTIPMRLIFKGMLNSYSSFVRLSNTLSNLGILNKGLLKFAKHHMKDKSERDRIFNSWTSFKKLKLHPVQLAKISVKYQILVHITLGHYDRVIPVSRIKPHLVINEFLYYETVEITHNKLFYYNFLDTPQISTSKSIE